MCCSAMMVLEYLQQEGAIGLTKSGTFQRKFVNWAVDRFEWPDYTAQELYQLNKVLNEDDIMPLAVAA